MNDLITPAPGAEGIRHRIEFARDNLHGIQQLILAMDQKSYLVLVIMGVTSAAFFSFAGGVLGKVTHGLGPGLIVPASAAWFLIEAALVLWFALRSIQGVVAAPATIDAPALVFPVALMKRYDGDAQRYFDRLHTLDSDDILRDYAAEIIKTSSVYVEKFHQVEEAVHALYRSLVPWLIGILATIVIRMW